MRTFTRLATIAFLIAGLLNFSVAAAEGIPLGRVVNAENAHLGDANASMGTNLFPGDSLQTEPGGSLRVRVGPHQVYLASASFATLQDDHATIKLKLDRGTLGFSSPAADRLEIQTRSARSEPPLVRPLSEKSPLSAPPRFWWPPTAAPSS